MATSQWTSALLEDVNCDLCGATVSTVFLVRLDGLSIKRCPSCDLAFVSPRPSPACLAKLYQWDYFNKDDVGNGVGYTSYGDPAARLGNLKIARGRLRHFIPEGWWRGLRVLEVGCATGDVANLLARRGASVLGVDLSSDVVERARTIHPAPQFRQGDIESLLGHSLRFDAIVALEVIEHVRSPLKFLEVAHRLLADSGLLLMSTPNLACGDRVGPASWAGFGTSFEHLYFLSPSTVRAYAAKAGFVVDRIATNFENGTVAESPKGTARESLGVRTRLEALLARAVYRWTRTRLQDGESGHTLVALLRKAPDSHRMAEPKMT
jgi:2-polyprenyl-3-methyl-5-hydroxy-6-metoxy-1,4-benzoquinol methylase